MTKDAAMPYSRNILFTLVLPLALVLCVPVFLVGGRLDFLGSMTNSWIRMAALLPFAAVLGLILFGAWAASASTATAPVGPFRQVRDPVGLGMLIAAAAQYWLYDWPAVIFYFVLLLVTMDCVIRFRVEPRMMASLDPAQYAAYEAYRAEVPRWWPRRWNVVRARAEPGSA